jgi:hypothetical protein
MHAAREDVSYIYGVEDLYAEKWESKIFSGDLRRWVMLNGRITHPSALYGFAKE